MSVTTPAPCNTSMLPTNAAAYGEFDRRTPLRMTWLEPASFHAPWRCRRRFAAVYLNAMICLLNATKPFKHPPRH